MAVPVTPISAIVPVRNEGDRILETILSIVQGRSCRFPLEIVIVDDASSDGACDRLSSVVEGIPEVRLLVHRLPNWSGIPFARNRGAEIASHPIYFITDGNTVFPIHWDVPIWRHFTSRQLLAVTIGDMDSALRGHGCRLRLPSMGASWIGQGRPSGAFVPVAACTGTVIDRSVFHGLGGYDERMPLYGAAEPEFSLRAWLSGYQIVNFPELMIYHRFRSPPERADFHSANRQVILRNYLRFATYYLPAAMLARTVDYYRRLGLQDLDTCLSELRSGDAWVRREQLRAALPHDFEWFVKTFALTFDDPGDGDSA